VTKRISRRTRFSIKDRGLVYGQTVVLLYLVTAKVAGGGLISINRNPAIAAWKKTDEALKKQGVKKAARPTKPAPNRPIRVNWTS